jgi:hypothetical protein
MDESKTFEIYRALNAGVIDVQFNCEIRITLPSGKVHTVGQIGRRMVAGDSFVVSFDKGEVPEKPPTLVIKEFEQD